MTKPGTDPFPISFFCTLFTLCVLFPATHSASSQTTNSAPFAEVALPDVLQWTASAFAGPLSPLPGRNGVVLTGNTAARDLPVSLCRPARGAAQRGGA